MSSERRPLICLGISLLNVLCAFGPVPAEIAADESPLSVKGGNRLELLLFVRSDSEQCKAAVSFAEQFVRQNSGIALKVIDVQMDEAGRKRYWELVHRYQVEKPSVPMFSGGQRLKFGFDTTERSVLEVKDLFAIHAYVREGCQHCADAKRFLNGLAQRWPGIHIVLHDVIRDSGAHQELFDLARRQGTTITMFPGIYLCGRLIAGYHSEATTGKQIEDLLRQASVTETDDSGAQHSIDDILTRMSVEQPDWQRMANAPEPDSDSLIRSIPAAEIRTESEPELPPVADERTENATGTYTLPVESPEGIELPWFGYVRMRDVGLPAFTFLIGLVDGFNPCAMWVLVFLLSVLVNVKSRKKIAAIAGSFVLVSGLAYFAFMAASLNLFVLIGLARPIQIALGLIALLIGAINVKDFFAFKSGITLSIPESAKPSIYAQVRRIVSAQYISTAIGLSVVLAVIVNLIELVCTAGLPALYTQILSSQSLPAWKTYAYLALYDVAYMLDDTLLVAVFVITLSHRKLREAEGRWLKLISGIVVLVLGLAMLFRPEWLRW